MPPSPDLAALEVALAKMTPGPWRQDYEHVIGDGDTVAGCVFEPRRHDQHIDNAAGIVALVNAAPALLARCRELERALLEACNRLDVIIKGEGGSVSANAPEMAAWLALAHPGPAAGEEG